MGNTNLPQFGANDRKNSLDTRSGIAQLTTGQQEDAVEEPAIISNPNPRITTEEALGGYTGTGHSPSGAT
ncbi:MAG: hypothetical protein ABI386_01180 [Rhodanobacter sp.]